MKTNTRQRKMSNTRKVIRLENKMIRDEIVFECFGYEFKTTKTLEELTQQLRGI